MRSNAHRKAFTLIEILVALAITSLLAGIAFALSLEVRKTAHRAECASNMRQLGSAVELYLADHDQNFFPYVQRTESGTIWYFGKETGSASAEGERNLDRTAGPLFPYINQIGSIEVCPAFDYGNALYKPKFKGASWGYGYNWKLGGGWSGRRPMNFTHLQNSAQVIVFADCAQANTFQAPASPSKPMLEEFYIINETFKTFHFRHGKTANLLFADGHVEAHQMLEGTADGNMESERLGRITPVGSSKFLK